MLTRLIIFVRGNVQGVGFRPFVYNLAKSSGLKGNVINTSNGVEIDLEGSQVALEIFCSTLQESPPPLAKIEEIVINEVQPIGYDSFIIGETKRSGTANAIVSTDVAICDECLKELLNPEDRRYRYPFINCTNCGPRYTIIKDIPYDREFTTMNVFSMCADCLSEYNDPGNRRFHAQPNACFACGPKVVLKDSSGVIIDHDDPIGTAARLLKENRILAIKGLGGYHLACKATADQPVSALRKLKIREDKPFAIMVRNITEAKQYCDINEAEVQILSSPARPIVLLRKRINKLAGDIAPRNPFLGVMLPYTPLHFLLFREIDFPLVMTSANLSDEPIAFQDDDALLRLGQVADYFLTHNRIIEHRCDDSVTRVYRNHEYLIRRARGYAPSPIKLNVDFTPLLAVGGEQKNTFCLTKGNYAFISHHIGDLENMETLQAFENEIKMYNKLFNIEPELVVHDSHPEYLSTKYAQNLLGVKNAAVQHHHAHIASCMAENGIQGNVLGVAFDGTGLGEDGCIWGGEFLYSSFHDFKRFAHLKYAPMPGGTKAIKEPWRMAVGYLYDLFGREWRKHKGANYLLQKKGEFLDTLEDMIDKSINCPMTSSMGRLFDAVAALTGIRDTVNYEGQAAVEFEQAAITWVNSVDSNYDYEIHALDGIFRIDTRLLFKGILMDLANNIEPCKIAYRFHETISDLVIDICIKGRDLFNESRVCLSGGVFQNMLLLDLIHRKLERNNFEVFIHQLVPTNDGGISLGQAVIANERGTRKCV